MKKYGTLIIGSAIAVLAVYYTVRNVSMEELAGSFRNVHYAYLFPTVVLICLAFLARAIRWRMLISPLKSLRTTDLFSPLMVGFMANILPARAGEVIRAYLLGKKHDIRFVASFATIIVERLLDLLLLFLLFVWILVFQSDVFDSNIVWAGAPLHDLAFKFGLASLILLVVLMVFIYLMVFHIERAQAIAHWFSRPLPDKWRDKIQHLMDTFSQGLQVVRDGKALFKVTMATAVVWACIVFSYYPLYWAFELQDKSMASLILLNVMICILITVLPTPAFIGSLNAGVFIALHEILRESEVAAVSFGFVSWGLNIGVVIAGGLYFILHDHISVRQLAEIEEET